MWTVALLIGANAALLCTKPLASVDPEALPAARTWVWWATKEYTELKKAPDVVLLGSSMLMHPIARVDADLLNQDLNYVQHHRSNYIEQALTKAGFKTDVCYNFALPGGMISDNYMVMRALMTQKQKPKVVVVTVSMRDFMDNQVKCVGATQAFKFLSRYTPIDDLVEISMPQIWQRFDFLAKKDIYLWGKKLDLQVVLSEKTKNALAPTFASHFSKSRLAEADPAKNLPINLRSEVEYFPVRAHEPVTWNDNRAEYSRRYRTANEKLFDVEEWFMRKMCDMAHERNIEIMLVNVPLTPDNHALMPAGSYENYRARLTKLAKQYDLPLVDLDGKTEFVKTDYYDTAHMNGTGGKKMVDAMVKCLTREPKLITALRQSNNTEKQVAGTGGTK